MYNTLNKQRELHRLGIKFRDTHEQIPSQEKMKFLNIYKEINEKQKNIIDPYPFDQEMDKKKKWNENLREVWKTTRRLIKRKEKREKIQTIKDKIKKRQQLLNEQPKRMIGNILEREHRRIVLDRIIETNEKGEI